MKKILLILLIIPVLIFSCGTSDRRPGLLVPVLEK